MNRRVLFLIGGLCSLFHRDQIVIMSFVPNHSLCIVMNPVPKYCEQSALYVFEIVYSSILPLLLRYIS